MRDWYAQTNDDRAKLIRHCRKRRRDCSEAVYFCREWRKPFEFEAPEKMYLNADGNYINELNHEGYLAIGAPGTVVGFDLLLKKFGTKTWKGLTAPAVKLAEKGFTLSWLSIVTSMTRLFNA